MPDTLEVIEYSSHTVSLSTLLFTTVNHLDTVSCYKTHSKKHQSLLCKLSTERAFLFNWGKHMGLLREKGKKFRPLDERLNNHEMRKVVKNTLNSIISNFEDTDTLITKYGLRRLSTDEAVVTKGVGFESSYLKIRCLSKKVQKKSSQRRKTSWVVHDRSRFTDLIEEIRGYNESLNRLLPPIVSSDIVEVVVSHQSLVSPAGGHLGAAQGGTTYSIETSALLPPNSSATVHGSFEISGQAFNTNSAPAYVPMIAPLNPPRLPYMIEEPNYGNVDMGGRVLLIEAAPDDPDLVQIEEAKHPSECLA